MSETKTEIISLAVFNEIKGQNRNELLLKSFHLQNAAETLQFKNLKNESMCKKCLTFWSNGKFTVELKSSKQKRRLRKKCLLDKYSKQLKETTDKKEARKLKKIIRRLNQQVNQIAIYKCLICQHETKVTLFKPLPPKPQKQSDPEKEIEIEVNKVPKKPVDDKTKLKKKNKKREKSSGLKVTKQTLVQSASVGQTKTFQKQNQMLKLAQMLKTSSSERSSATDKLKHILK